ncbi:MAG: succinyldiaminopimelate transaminase [Proteobacteria bacterium]|nr:succinyldiaminopimelate transaminase [Pseudomonadota bacterium]
MNLGLLELKPYPFEQLAAIRARVAPPAGLPLINLSIGEPQHPTPPRVHQALIAHLDGTARYPATRGIVELRQAIVAWANRRFHLADGLLDAERHVLPVNGTREALFAIAQCVVAAASERNLVVMPNPFYQIYEGAALLAGGTPYFLHCPADLDFRPDWDAVPDSVWQRTALVYVCSPGNPSGAILTSDDYARLTALADRHGFVIVADECYSELYYDERQPPLGLLEWCAAHGRADFRQCLVMHSLSKRSNAPGLRSGFVAGDAAIIEPFYRYRTYQGGAMPVHVQHASIAAWSDEEHVVTNRALYRRKFDAVVPLLAEVAKLTQPAAGFYLWPELATDDLLACERLLGEAGVLVLPGSFLARDSQHGNPGKHRLRIALVADQDECVQAARRMQPVLRQLQGL